MAGFFLYESIVSALLLHLDLTRKHKLKNQNHIPQWQLNQ